MLAQQPLPRTVCTVGPRSRTAPSRSTQPNGRVRGTRLAASDGTDGMVSYPGVKKVALPSSQPDKVSNLKMATKEIRDFGRVGDAAGAVAVLGSLEEPDILAVTATISACVDCNDITRARAVFDNVVEGGAVMPDELLFSVLLRAYGGRKPPAWGEVSSLLSKMRNTYGIPPQVTTYNTLLQICADNNDYDRGIQLIDRMEQEGVEPNNWTNSAVSSRKSLRHYLKRAFANSPSSSATADDE